MTILQAINDPNLFRPFLGEDLKSWRNWSVALKSIYGLPIFKKEQKDLLFQCTGRRVEDLPEDGFSTALLLVGRRSGKSRISAIVGAFEALFRGHEKRLSKGETGLVAIVSPTRYQSTIVWKYLRAIFDVPVLQQELIDQRENEKALILRNGLEIRILTGDFRTVRGPTVVCAIVDEICFFGLTEESKVRNDTELIRALRPALMTSGGKLIGISSKYARKGWAFNQWRKYHGSNQSNPSFAKAWRTLVWDSDSKTMNPTLPQSEIDAAYEEDPQAARSEFGGEWREDVAEYLPRSVIESLVIKGRRELIPRSGKNYKAFVDLSGGRSDDAALAIAHKNQEGLDILDFVQRWKAPFNPTAVIQEMGRILSRYRVHKVTGDNYAAEFVAEAFRNRGYEYEKARLPKNNLYRELLPHLCSGKVELLENEILVSQLSSLERKTRSGGKDIIDHPTGAKDDLANAVAGVVVECNTERMVIGAL